MLCSRALLSPFARCPALCCSAAQRRKLFSKEFWTPRRRPDEPERATAADQNG